MENLIRRILKEETNNDSYIVFVAGTNKTGITHQSQYDAFKNSVGETDKIIKYFNYDDHKGSNSELFTFLEANMLTIPAIATKSPPIIVIALIRNKPYSTKKSITKHP